MDRENLEKLKRNLYATSTGLKMAHESIEEILKILNEQGDGELEDISEPADLQEEGDVKLDLTSLIHEDEEDGVDEYRDKRIIEEYKTGKRIKDIGEEFDISPSAVYPILRNNGVSLRSEVGEKGSAVKERIKSMEKDRLKNIIEEYQLGTSMGAIQSQFDITTHTLYAIIDLYGLGRRGYSNNGGAN